MCGSHDDNGCWFKLELSPANPVVKVRVTQQILLSPLHTLRSSHRKWSRNIQISVDGIRDDLSLMWFGGVSSGEFPNRLQQSHKCDPPPTNAAFWMQELQNSHVVFCWSLIAPLRKTIIFLKYNHHTDSSLTEVMTLLNKHDIHIFCWQSNSDYNQTGFAALLCLHVHVQCAQAMAMNTAVTGPFWFYNGWKNGRILLKITWTDWIATPKDVIRGLLVGGESCHPACPPPYVHCQCYLWVEKFVGFNGREEDKNGASKAFISKLKINSWAWAAWTNRRIPCLVPLSQCQLKHLQHCTKKL